MEDVQKAAAWYEAVVGLIPETKASDEWAWFWSGQPEASARLALHRGKLLFEEHSPLGADARWGPIHYALRTPQALLESRLSRLSEAGVTVYGPVRLEWMRANSHYFYDLDGNLLEFWTPDSGPD